MSGAPEVCDTRTASRLGAFEVLTEMSYDMQRAMMSVRMDCWADGSKRCSFFFSENSFCRLDTVAFVAGPATVSRGSFRVGTHSLDNLRDERQLERVRIEAAVVNL